MPTAAAPKVFTVDDLQALALQHELIASYLRVLAAQTDSPAIAEICLKHRNIASLYREIASRIIHEQKEKEVMKRVIDRVRALVLIVALALVVGGVTAAQDVTVEPTAEVTPAPSEPTPQEPVVIDQTGFRVGLFGFATFVIVTFLGGAGMGAAWQAIRKSKQAQDNLEKAYESVSPKTQADIRAGYETAARAWERVDQTAREVLEFLNRVTDRLPNEAQAAIRVAPLPPDAPPTPKKGAYDL